MAANKFATMLHRNTNKLTMILIYVVLEWTLIVLLLLNSLFSYLIIKFAEYFGLKPPCLWCSRVDHIFEHGKNKNMHRDLLCEAHAKEISKLGYCSNHQKLVESQDMCEDCLSSRPQFREVSKSFTFFGMIQTDEEKVVENGHVSLNCSCCDVTMLPQVVIKPSWDVLEYMKQGEFIIAEAEEDDHLEKSRDFATDLYKVEHDFESKDESSMVSDVNEVGLVSESISELNESRDNEVLKLDVIFEEEEEVVVEEKQDIIMKDQAIQVSIVEDAFLEILPQHLDFFIDYTGHRLLPVELIDSATEEDQKRNIARIEDQGNNDEQVSNSGSEGHEEAKTEVSIDEICRGVEEVPEHFVDMNEELQFGGFESMEIEEDENSLVFYAKEYSNMEDNNFQVARTLSQDSQDVQEPEAVDEDEKKPSDVHPAGEDIAQIQLNETEAEVVEHSVNMNEESQNGGFESVEIEEDENTLVVYAEEFSEREIIISHDSEDVQEPGALDEEEKKPSGDHPGVEDVAQLPLHVTEADISIDTEIPELDITNELQTQEPHSEDVRESKAVDEEEKKPSDVHPAGEDIAQIPLNETEADVSIGTEIPDLDVADEIPKQEAHSSYESIREDSSNEVNDHGLMQVQEYTIKLNTLTVEVNDHLKNRSVFSEVNEIEGEDKFPDTPTSVDSLNHLHKKLLLLEKKDWGTEDSLDGSVTSELESGDGVVTSERLKSALRAERKALHVLYTELEEERNASAIAANETMAMINRLQEEKAAMQMEALHYQRMMEEQAEYDQEALQLLNELMMKREKEKEELEKELEIYRKKVFEHESKEKLMMLRKGGFSSPSYSNAEDSDAASIDLNQEVKEEDGFYNSHREFDNDYTPVNAVVNLEESIADFEEERVSILEQLKFLEEKLMTIDDEHHEENGNHIDENGHSNGLENGHGNGFHKKTNGTRQPERRSMFPKGKSLLPLFDATSDENGDIILNGNENGFDSNGVHNKNLAVEDELEHVYERLQALEADREFLKHCISSLNKGDKGMYLLHEILQHLKDLRNVDLRVKNLSDGIVI